jgi:radical SAM superfamily enzyme YgiQ (UPF0313 family)
MDILFINPNRVQPPVAPLALDSIGEALHTRGMRARVVDLCCEGPFGSQMPESYLRDLDVGNVDAILLTVRNMDDAYYFSQAPFLPQFRALVQSIRETFHRPIILGGSGFSIAPEPILGFLGADLGVAGAQEGDLLHLLASLGDEDAYPEIPGLVWREGHRIRSNPPSPPTMDEDFFSPRRTVNNPHYFQAGGMVGLETKRGCDGVCRYCVDPVAKGKRVFTKPLPYLIKEVESLVDQGVTVFHLCDSEFNMPRGHAFDVCEALVQTGLCERVRWFTYASPLGFDEALAFRMAEAGCAGINFGADHSHPGMLRALGRQHGAEDLARTVEATRKAGMPVLFDLLLGGPGETRETLREAIDFCREIEVPRVGANCGIRIYPGTAISREVLKQGPLHENPNIEGRLEGNEELLYPVFFVSHEMGRGWQDYLTGLVRDDARFLLPLEESKQANYNYNENEVLVKALREGHRGAFWDILRRVQEGLPPLDVPGSRHRGVEL